MTGQVLLNIIMLLIFVVSFVLHYYKVIELFDGYSSSNVTITIFFVISIAYFIIYGGVLIGTHWNTPIF